MFPNNNSIEEETKGQILKFLEINENENTIYLNLRLKKI